MKLIILLIGLIGICQAASIFDTLETEWAQFKSKHLKEYENEIIEALRKEIFIKNHLFIKNHNHKYDRGLVSYKLAMNHFGDLENHEFTSLMNGFNATKSSNSNHLLYKKPDNEKLPASFDWRKKGAVTPVKDQGQCGSCWAFSATGSLEGQHFLKTGKLISLSEQNLVDCSGDYGNEGCSGGLMNQAFDYIKDNKGIDTEKSYPYEAYDDSCRFSKKNIGATDSGYVDIQAGSESDLKSAIVNSGPISVAIDASNLSFQFYSEGVYDEMFCSSDFLDHGVLAVGYGAESGTDYWLVKNSWGNGWGENGYIKMSRNKNNQCGIASQASYPIV